jgi:tetratricopeptide (TPR) repeat protein
MKQIILLPVCLLLVFALQAQKTIKGNLFGQDYTFTVPSTSSGGNNNTNNSGAWKGNGNSGATAPSSNIVITDEYKKKGLALFIKAMEHWDKDWDKTIRLIKKALVFDEYNAHYAKALEDARGHHEWDEGVKDANDQKWEKAINHYEKALEKFPGNDLLRQNIVGCSYRKIDDEAEKYYNRKDWVNAAAYYQVLMKNFNEKSDWVLTRYSLAMSKVSAMPPSEGAYTKLNGKVAEIKKDLVFINYEWQ